MSSSSSSGKSSTRKPIRQLIRELNERFAEIAKFNENLERLGAGFEAVDKKVAALEQEMGRVEEYLVRLGTDHNELVKLLQPPELQRYPADLMPRDVRTDSEGKVLESKMVTRFEEGPVVAADEPGTVRAQVRPGGDGDAGPGSHPGPGSDPVIVAGGELLANIEAKEKEVHTLWSADTTEVGVMERRLAELEDMRKLTHPESQPESIAEDEATHGACEFWVDWADCPHCGHGGHVCDRACIC